MYFWIWKKKPQQSLKNDPGTQQKLGMLYRIKHCFLGNNLCINSEGLYVKFASELRSFYIHNFLKTQCLILILLILGYRVCFRRRNATNKWRPANGNIDLYLPFGWRNWIDWKSPLVLSRLHNKQNCSFPENTAHYWHNML
jgi:hypothetical protein